MSAIGIHHTEVKDGAWDGPAAKANLKNDGTEAYYRGAFAWEDPEGDKATKSAYKFIHHFVASDGKVGAASKTACSAGIAILNGGRGGANIPEADRKGVWAHLAAHLKDAGVAADDVPELKSGPAGLERRSLSVAELRVDADGDDDGDKMPTIRGHAAVFNQPSEEMGGWMRFREQIAPGAFKDSIKKDDVRALWNHDPNHVLGRTKSKTLKLKEDDKGLAIEINPPKTQTARDLVESIRRGDVSHMSFGFDTQQDSWDYPKDEDGKALPAMRTLHKVKLFDVSPVTYPAYPQTDVNCRSIDLGAVRIEAGFVEERSASQLSIMRARLELAAVE